MKTNGKELADSARARSDIYGLLATVFREEPTEAFIKELRGSRFSGVFSDMEVDLGAEFYSGPETEVREPLVLEFTELFIGPKGHISAHESVFVEADRGAGGLWGAKTVEVKNFIESTGLSYESQYTGIPDHISVELELMQKLAELESDKWINEDRKSAEYCQSVQIMFLQQHLLVWIPALCDAVVKKAKLPFYRAMAELTDNFMEYEKQNTRVNEAA
jgi:TorA maturation chaperone TorD